jgi:hypothetical protein
MPRNTAKGIIQSKHWEILGQLYRINGLCNYMTDAHDSFMHPSVKIALTQIRL